MGIAVSKKTFNLKVQELEKFKKDAEAKEDKLKKIEKKLQGDIGKLIHNLIEHIDDAKSFIIMTNNIASSLESYSKTLNETASKQLEDLKNTIKTDINQINAAMKGLKENEKAELSELLKTIQEYEEGLETAVEQDAKGDVVQDVEGEKKGSTGGTGGTPVKFGKRKRRRRFGSLYCPKAIKGAYGRRKPSKTSKKFKKEIKRRRKTVKRKKPVKRRKTVKRKKTTKRRKPVKRSSLNSLSGIFNIINPNSISKILQENPDIMGKINDLRQLKENGGFNPKELVVIAALSTLSDMTVEDASNQFSMLKGSGMSTDSIFDQAMGNSTPPVPKKSFMQGILGRYGRRKRKKVKRKRKKIKRKRKKVKRKRKKKVSKKKVSKKPSSALKRLCKKHKVRLTVKRGKKRVYKSEKILKKQCKNKIKKKK